MANKKISELETKTLAQMKAAGAFLAMAVAGSGTFKVAASEFGFTVTAANVATPTTYNEIVQKDSQGAVIVIEKGDGGQTYFYRKSYSSSSHGYGIIKFSRTYVDSETGKAYEKTWSISNTGQSPDTWVSEVKETSSGTTTEIVHDETLTGDGSAENPLAVNESALDEVITEEVGQAVETIKSKVIYTLDMGAVQSGISIHGNGSLFAKGTLFNPNMNQKIVANTTKIFFATNQAGNCQNLFFAIYRYDLSDNTLHWVANTDNVAQMTVQTGLHTAPITQCAEPNDGETLQLSSNKLYYLVMFTDANSVKVVGNNYSENFNTIPRMGWYADNLNSVTAQTIRTLYPTITPQGENTSRFFAAISNINISGQG